MEHELITETVTVKPSMLAHYAEEPDDASTEFDDTPYEAVKLSCTCGGLDGWANPGEDLTERFERHVRLSTMIL